MQIGQEGAAETFGLGIGGGRQPLCEPDVESVHRRTTHSTYGNFFIPTGVVGGLRTYAPPVVE